MSTALQATSAEREVSFIPFGATEADEIRLSVVMVKNFIANKTKSGAACSDEQALKFIMLCKARRLNPWEGDAYLIGFDGKDGPEFSLVTAHQAFLKRAEVHPEFDGMVSGVIVRLADSSLLELEGDFHLPEQTLIGAWARIYFKTRKFPVFKKLRLSTFDKGFGRWKIDPAGMIVKCAEADALRSAFPNVTGGMYLREEIEVETIPSTVMAPRQSRLVPPPQNILPAPQAEASAAPASPPGRVAASPAPTTAPRTEPPKPKPPAIMPPPPEMPPPPSRVSSPPARRKPTLVEEPLSEPAAAPEPPYEAPQGDPEPEAGDPLADPPDAPAAEPEQLPVRPVEFSVDPAITLKNLRAAMAEQNIAEKRMLDWCVDRDLAKPSQNSLHLLAGSKLKALCEKFPEIVAEISLNL